MALESATTENHNGSDTGCRTLVPLQQASGPELTVHAAVRHDTGFIAQLIATAAHAPQTRMLRRASAADAQAIYVGAGLRGRTVVSSHGHALARTI